MSQKISDVTNGAKLVRWYDDYDFAVSHGRHTVNFYRIDFENPKNVVPITSISVGDFASGQITKESVIEGISTTFNKDFR